MSCHLFFYSDVTNVHVTCQFSEMPMPPCPIEVSRTIALFALLLLAGNRHTTEDEGYSDACRGDPERLGHVERQ